MDTFIRAGDVRSFKECKRKFWFERFLPDQEQEKSAYEKHRSKKGAEHKLSVMNKLEKEFQVNMIRATSPEHTQELMAQGVPAIYQPQFVNEDQRIEGRADFLLRTKSGEYEVGDAIRCSNLKKRNDIKLQHGIYRMLTRSTLPARVFLRREREETVDDTLNDKVLETLKEIRETLDSDTRPTGHFKHERCSACGYYDTCGPEFEASSELTLLPGIDDRIADTLKSQMITTIEELSTVNPETITDGRFVKKAEHKRRFVLQAKSSLSGEIFEIAPPEIPGGTWVHLDLETHSFSDAAPTIVYLWGLLPHPCERDSMESVWSENDGPDDKRAWCEFLSVVTGYREKYSDLKIAHFTDFERQRISEYAERYEMLDNPTVQWLLGENTPLVDLHKIVVDSLVLPVEKYGIKEICKNKDLVNFQWELEDSGSLWSVGRYMDYLEATSDEDRESIKHEIVTYNRDDVLATRALEMWLRRAPWRADQDCSPLTTPLGMKEQDDTAKPSGSTNTVYDEEVDVA